MIETDKIGKSSNEIWEAFKWDPLQSPVGKMSQVRPFYFLERSLDKICQESDKRQSCVPEADLALELDVEAVGLIVDQSFEVQARLVKGVVVTVLLNSPSFLSAAVELKTI